MSSAYSSPLFLLSLLSLLLLSLPLILADSRAYNKRERVMVEMNTVGPFHNPAESYQYYSLPFCPPTGEIQPESDSSNLGESLAGDRRRASAYSILFGMPVENGIICSPTLSQDDIKKFRDAITSHYIFEMFIDDLPVKGFIGEMEEVSNRVDKHIHKDQHIYLFTHLDFSIARNGGHVIAVNLTTDPNERTLLEYGKNIPVDFSYNVKWIDTQVEYVDRLELHSKLSITDQSIDIHWLSIINTFVLVILLTAFLGVVLIRVLHKDFARYMELDEEEMSGEEAKDESGWKLVHGDVFRFPKSITLLTAALGNGAQILALIVIILGIALLGGFYPGNRGAMYSAAVLGYALTAFIAGHVGTTYYLQFGGAKWAWHSVLTASLFAGPFFATFCVLNSVAWYYGSSSALPALTIIIIIGIWSLVSFPMTIFGSMRARKFQPKFDAPCKTKLVERELPPMKWYRNPLIHLVIAGFLPFSAIYIELHYIFASVWGHRVYTLFGILSLAFVMLIIVTAFITVALVYFQLAAEDYNWWNRSFINGASTGLFMYGYAVFYYFYRSEMGGMIQSTFFFGYMAMISYGFCLMLGTVAFIMALEFVKHIYRSIKVD